MNLPDQSTPYPIHYSLGESSKRVIIHQEDDLCVSHEHLFQDATPTRFYHFKTDIFCFVLKGELYLQQDDQETVLKKHQGIWLRAQTVNISTLLSPAVELCFIQFKGTTQNIQDTLLKKVSSGSVESTLGKSHIKTWPLWQGKSGSISLELYPPHYTETLHYQKVATQYILPLNGDVLVSNHSKQLTKSSNLGTVILKKIPRAIFNPSNESITVLSITTQQSKKGRVLLLKKPLDTPQLIEK